jgi:hypothetical protein
MRWGISSNSILIGGNSRGIAVIQVLDAYVVLAIASEDGISDSPVNLGRDVPLNRMVRRSKRRQQRRFKALGLFIAVWLNLALQPCAMALEIQQERSSAAAAQAHDHGSMDQEAPCDAAASCMLADELNHDARNGQVKFKQVPAILVAMPAPDEPVAADRSAGHGPWVGRHASPYPGAPPDLNDLYCVYLD